MSISRIIAASVALALASTVALADSSRKNRRAAEAPSEDGYLVRHVTGPGGEKRDVMEIPGSVTIISRKLMDDTQATSLGDALRFAPGVTVGR